MNNFPESSTDLLAGSVVKLLLGSLSTHNFPAYRVGWLIIQFIILKLGIEFLILAVGVVSLIPGLKMDLSLADSAEKFDANGCAVVFAYMQLKAKFVVFCAPLPCHMLLMAK